MAKMTARGRRACCFSPMSKDLSKFGGGDFVLIVIGTSLLSVLDEMMSDGVACGWRLVSAIGDCISGVGEFVVEESCA